MSTIAALRPDFGGVSQSSWSHNHPGFVLLMYMLKLHVWEHFLAVELGTDLPSRLQSSAKSLGGNFSGKKIFLFLGLHIFKAL